MSDAAHQITSPYPNRTLAGVTIIDTPIVRSAQSYIRSHSSNPIYNHVMRAFLFGALIINNNTTLSSTVDREVHAVGALLHDLGWDRSPNNSDIVSSDRRFEVDGAIAARGFIRGHVDGKGWEERRVQLVWDGIALHTERKIALYKELEVQLISKGTGLDFDGPGLGVSEGEYADVVKEFPRDGFVSGLNDTIVWLCQTKPASTYDTWMQTWGDRYVAEYSQNKVNRIDTIFAHLQY
ncbi:hypothetical protein EJ08DRAFT_581472 [Tothia fuscella]|uniref:HD domain-containing protein n=1 Tax=Tothia fuscella TaxID=1048955 RepID=A0A9P4NYF8_9PEZI|nr:hypothetical protein EJ08DRAFT_581472 [Tothia fuscella]